jgi:hypothetical protein
MRALAASALVPFARVFGLLPPSWIVAVPFLGRVQHAGGVHGNALDHMVEPQHRLGKPGAHLAGAGVVVLPCRLHNGKRGRKLCRSKRS